MKTDAKMGVVIERPESVLPVEVKLVESNGGVVLMVHRKNGLDCALLRLDEKGVTLKPWCVGALSGMGFNIKQTAGCGAEYLAVVEG